jgi:CubicO group peptidase (beta-lactamase class C family)
VSRGAITSIAVDRGGAIEERYLQGDSESLRNTRSVTKTVAGMLVGIAIARGELPSVDVCLGDVLSVPPDKASITVESLLTMSSILDCDDGDPASPGNEERMYPCADWVGFVLGLPTRATRTFSYCTAGVTLLAAVLEAATGVPVPEYAEQMLFRPLAIPTARWPLSALGLAQTGGGLELRTRDLLALGALYRDGGDGIVPREWIERSTRPHARVDDDHEYGYLWWLRSYDGIASYAMSGAGGSRVAVFPELETVIVVTAENFGRPDQHELTDALIRHLVGARDGAVTI